MWSDSIKMSPWKKAEEVEKKQRQIATRRKTSPWYITHHICNTHPKVPPARWEKSPQQHFDQNIDFSTIFSEAPHWKLGRHNSCWIAELTLLRLWKRAMGGGLVQLIQRKQSIKYHCFDGKLNLRCAERCKIRGAQLLFSLFERLWMCSVGGPRSQLNYLPLMQCTLFRPQRTKDPSWRWGIIIFGRKTCGRGFCNTRDYYQYRRLSDSLTGLVSKKSGLEISWGSNCIYCGTNFLLFTN